MIQFTDEQFKEVKEKGEEFYKSLGEVYCPYFKEKIAFNAQGLEHLRYKHRGKSRLEQDQYMRFKLVYLAPEVIKISSSLQGIWETKKFEHIKVHSRLDKIFKNVTFYEFIAIIKRNRIKIIVKQVESGKKFFWSIIPFWGMNKETMTRVFHDGNPDED